MVMYKIDRKGGGFQKSFSRKLPTPLNTYFSLERKSSFRCVGIILIVLMTGRNMFVLCRH